MNRLNMRIGKQELIGSDYVKRVGASLNVNAIHSLGKNKTVLNTPSLTPYPFGSTKVNAQTEVTHMGNVVKLDNEGIANSTTHMVSTNSRINRSGKKTEAGFAFRLLLVVDNSVYDLIERLKIVLEAPSIGDVIRQAVRCYALRLSANGGQIDDCLYTDTVRNPATDKKLNVRIPTRTKIRLDALKDATGETYTAIIMAGLAILEDKAIEEEGILLSLENGDYDK